MRSIKLKAVQLVLFLPMLASAATPSVLGERALREECSAFSEAGMWECLDKKVRASEMTLRKAQEKAASILSKWDEDSKFISQARAKLSASNEAFTKYRDAQCSFAASLGGGAIGSALDMGRFACMAELNNRRAEQLRDALSDMPLK